jgi:murein L,D-transpeptidase YcbB/YkuD
MKSSLYFLFVLVAVSLLSCREQAVESLEAVLGNSRQDPVMDTIYIQSFFKRYPDLQEYTNKVKHLYSKRGRYIWYDCDGPSEFASVLYNEFLQIADEGISAKFPYESELRVLMEGEYNHADPDTELLLSSLYFFYLKNVYHGLDAKKSEETKWFLPRNELSYTAWIDSLSKGDGLLKKPRLFSQYYKLRKGLKRYREIERNGGWEALTTDQIKSIRPGDSSSTIAAIRRRLVAEGYLDHGTNNPVYDKELQDAVKAYQLRHFRNTDGMITPAMIREWNIPVSERIRTIAVNMERCRWISSSNTSTEFIAVNIPSFRLHYYRNGKVELVSRVVVGKEMHKTAVFSGDISYIAFSPYWNVPPSILENEIKPAVSRNANYLEQHNYEWFEGRLRQKPGPANSLGLVKFMFPNSNNIYLHDTPSKSLFNNDVRAFSHGCIRVEKARELAYAITKIDGGWPPEKVDKLMSQGTESIYRLNKKIPVYIAYFTAWGDDDGNIAFFNDLYERDQRLDKFLQQ